MTIVFKVSDNIKAKMIEYYNDKLREKTPPYALFQADEADTIVTLYESGKVMFQGISADIDANMWKDLEKTLNNRNIDLEISEKEKQKDENQDLRFKNVSTIGTDEVGTGDYFGPVVVTAAYVSVSDMKLLMDLGVRDSKKLTDNDIIKIAPTLIKKLKHITYILDNKTYNEKPTNMNKIKAILHNKVLIDILKKHQLDFKYIVIDQFCYPRLYFNYLKEAKEKVTKVVFATKAEDKCLSVAAASIISRYIFLQEIVKLSENVDVLLKKGAGMEVDKQGAEILKKYGKEKLALIAKLNFKNTEKINKLANLN